MVVGSIESWKNHISKWLTHRMQVWRNVLESTEKCGKILKKQRWILDDGQHAIINNWGNWGGAAVFGIGTHWFRVRRWSVRLLNQLKVENRFLREFTTLVCPLRSLDQEMHFSQKVDLTNFFFDVAQKRCWTRQTIWADQSQSNQGGVRRQWQASKDVGRCLWSLGRQLQISHFVL